MSALFRLYAPEECASTGYPFAWRKCPRCQGYGWLSGDQPHPEGLCRSPVQTAWVDTDGFDANCCDSLHGCPLCETAGSVKNLVRQQAGHRCIRCWHPFRVGESGEMEGPAAEAKATAADMGLSVEMFDQLVLENADRDLPPEKELLALEGARRVNWSDCNGDCTHGGPYRYKALGLEPDWNIYDGPDSANAQGFYTDQYHVQAAWRILTVHHLDEVKANLRWWNLVALCQRCHLEIQGKVTMDRPWPWDHTEWFKPYVAGFYALKYRGLELTREQTEADLDALLALGQQEEGVERMAL